MPIYKVAGYVMTPEVAMTRFIEGEQPRHRELRLTLATAGRIRYRLAAGAIHTPICGRRPARYAA